MKATLRICAFQAMVAIPLSALADPFCESVPAKQYRLVSCNLSLESISVPNAVLYKPRMAYTVYVFDEFDLQWTPNIPHISPGQGVTIVIPQSVSVCFRDPTNAPVLPLNLDGGQNLVSCQSNMVATFEDIVGRAPVNDTVMFRLNPGGDLHHYETTSPYFPAAPDWSRFGYTNGTWHPTVPNVAVGEAVVIVQSAQFIYQPAALNSRVVAGKFTFDMETVYGKAVTIEYTDSLPPTLWQELTTFIGTGHRRTVTDQSGDNPTPRFYRIRTSQ